MDGQAEKDTSKFDWVTARSLCSLPNVFKELRLQVKEDVKTRKVTLNFNDRGECKLNVNG